MIQAEFEETITKYMKANPGAENPFNVRGLYTDEQIMNLIVQVDFQQIEFADMADEDGNLIPDLTLPFVDGEPVEGYEPPKGTQKAEDI